MFSFIRNRLEEIGHRLRERYPERVVAVYAFGSRVRGDHKEWSDIDLLVIVRKKDPQIEKEIINLIIEEEMKGGLLFSPVIKDLIAFEQEKRFNTPFYENIKKEGIEL